jgi:CPA2 family monovalent cation:H+ antiporter-2
VSSILRGGLRHNIPDGNSQLFPHDRIQVIGSDEQLAQLRQALEHEVLEEDLDVEKREMKLHQLLITDHSPFLGKTLQESGIRSDFSCMVVGLEEGKENLSPITPTHVFADGDIIWLVGEQADIDRLLTHGLRA